MCTALQAIFRERIVSQLAGVYAALSAYLHFRDQQTAVRYHPLTTYHKATLWDLNLQVRLQPDAGAELFVCGAPCLGAVQST
jgi:hypothetical protein